jgi:hypothetical protein
MPPMHPGSGSSMYPRPRILPAVSFLFGMPGLRQLNVRVEPISNVSCQTSPFVWFISSVDMHLVSSHRNNGTCVQPSVISSMIPLPGMQICIRSDCPTHSSKRGLSAAEHHILDPLHLALLFPDPLSVWYSNFYSGRLVGHVLVRLCPIQIPFNSSHSLSLRCGSQNLRNIPRLPRRRPPGKV